MVALNPNTVTSWRMKVGFVGLRIAQIIRTVSNTMNTKMTIHQHMRLKSLCFFPLWWWHSFTDMVAVVEAGDK